MNVYYSYDARNRLTNLSVAPASLPASPLLSYAYTLDAAGHRTSVTELSGRKAAYAYDNLYRLTSGTIASDPGGQNGAIGYIYDPVGNRAQQASTVPAIAACTFFYDANDRFTAGDTYDANGNTVSSGGTVNVYDFENHLIQKDAGITIVYDGDGNRVKKTVAGVTTLYLVDDQNPTGYAQVMGEEAPSTAVLEGYVYGLEQINRVKINGAAPTVFYVHDGHGSVRALTNATGAVTDTYDYDAYGNLIHSTGSTPNVYLFAGEQYDPDLGLYYNRARYLNTNTGRFWTMDTFEGNDVDPLSIHKYLFAEADPVDNIDPCGKCLPSNPEYGETVQQYIFEDFTESTGGLTNISISRVIGKSVPSGSLMPDLIDPYTLSSADIGQVYEIKSVYSTAAAVAKVNLYASILNFYGSGTGLKWIPGITYLAPAIVPINSTTFATTQQPFPGVITYCVINQTELLTLAFAATTAGLYLEISTLVAASSLAFAF